MYYNIYMFKFDNKDILITEYIVNRLDATEIAAKYNVGLNTVRRALYRHNINKPMRFPIIFTEEQKSVLYGTLLGDGNLSIQKNGTNAELRCEHSIKQSEYLKYKFDIFKPWINNDKPSLYMERKSKKIGETNPSIKFGTVAHPLFTKVYHEFYPNKIKIINKEILNEINSLALSIWFQDDGSYHHSNANNGNVMKLATNSFSLSENNLIISWFKEKYNIICSIRNDKYLVKEIKQETYHLEFNKESRERMLDLIRPYVHESMKYKLDPYMKSNVI